LGPIVNCEKRFLMQDSVPTARRRPLMATRTAGANVVLSEKTRGKRRTDDRNPDEGVHWEHWSWGEYHCYCSVCSRRIISEILAFRRRDTPTCDSFSRPEV